MKLTRLTSSLLLALCGCLALTPESHAQAPLIWAADGDGGIPYIFTDAATGEQIGFEVDIADALARELGRPIHFKQYQFDRLFAGLERRDFDFAMNGLEIVPENQRRALFTRPYYLYQLQLVVRRGDKNLQTLQHALEKELTIGTLTGSAAHRHLKDMKIPFKTYDEQKGPYFDLAARSKEIHGVLMDLPIALYYAGLDPELKYAQQRDGLEFAGPPFAEGYYGIAVHKDDAGLANQLNRALEKLQQTGELKRILQKWELWNPDQLRLYTFQAKHAAAEGMDYWKYFPLLLWGAGMTVLLTFASMALAILLGLPIALCRLYAPWPVRTLAVLYVEFFRGIPVLLLLYFLYYGLADISPTLSLGALEAAILGFGLNYAAYEAEIYRAGISAIPTGQWEAAASLGMSPLLTFRRIILPQALRVILPPMTNDLVALFKDTSVVSIIALTELSKQYQILSQSAGYVEIGLATAALYLVMSVPLGYLSRFLEKRWAK